MAGRIKGITIEIGGDVTKLDKALRDVNNSIKDTQSQLKDVERLLKLDPGNTELLAQKQQLLAKAIEDTRKKLETLKEAERQAQEQFQRGEISQEQYQGLQREVIATELKLNNLEDQAKKTGISFEAVGAKALALADKLKDGLATAAKAAAKGFEAVESVGKKTEEAVTTALKGFATAATAVAGFGTAAVKTGMEFDAAMSQIAATLGLTTQDIENNVNGAGDTFDLLRQKALDMGSSTNFTSKEAAEGLNILAMSGYDAYESMDMIEDVLHLAAAGSMDMANAAGYVSGAMKGFNDETKDSAYYADLMAKGATLANTSVAELGASLSDGAATAKTYGQSAETTTLALLRLAEQGETGTAASTALAAAMKNLYAPTNSAKKAMQELGVSAFDPTTGAARDFNVVVDELNSALSDYTDEQRTAYAQTIFGIQGFNAYNKMVVTSTEKVDEWAAALENAAGEAARQYDTMTDNLLGDLDKLSSAFEGLQIVVSDALTPMVREFAQFGASAMDALRKGFEDGGVTGFMSALSGIVTDGVTMLAGKAPEFASVTLQFAEAMADGILGARFTILESANEILITLHDGISSWLSQNSTRMIELGNGILRIIFQGFLTAGDIISENIGQFIPLIANAFASYHEALFTVGIEILGAIGQGIIDSKDEIQGIASDTIAGMVIALRDNAPMIIEGGLALLEALVGAIEENLPLIIATGAEIIARLVAGIATASPAVQAIVGTAVLPYILKIAETASSVGKLVGDAMGLIGNVINGVGTVVSNVVKVASGAISTVISIGGKLMSGIQALWALMLANPITIVIAAIAALVAAFVLLWNNCEEFRNFWIGLWENLKEAASAAWEAITGAFTAAWEAIQTAWGAASGFFGGIWDGIRSVGSGAAEAVQSAFSRAWDAVTSAWNGAISFFGGIWSSITGVFSNAWDLFSNIGGNIVNGIKNGISAAWNGLTSWVSGLFSGLVKSVKSLLGIASPSKVFAGIGSNMALGIEAGWDDEYKAIKDKIEGGLSFGAASVGLTANTSYSAQRTAQDGQQGNFGGSGDTYVTINSPVAVDPVQAAREWKKTTQRMAMGYV